LRREKKFGAEKNMAYPVSTGNTDEPLRGSFKTRISDPPRKSTTWKIGLNGRFRTF